MVNRAQKQRRNLEVVGLWQMARFGSTLNASISNDGFGEPLSRRPVVLPCCLITKQGSQSHLGCSIHSILDPCTSRDSIAARLVLGEAERLVASSIRITLSVEGRPF